MDKCIQNIGTAYDSVVVLFNHLLQCGGLSDLFMALMTIMNLVTICLLGRIAFMAFRDYIKQKKEGGNPVFNPSDINVQEGLDYWKE